MINIESKRNINIDFLKFVAIILVLIGHSIQYGSGYNYFSNELYFNNILFKFIYSFHMPLFMIISGYLFYSSIKKYCTKEVVIKKIKTLLIPIFSFSIIELLWKLFIDNMSYNDMFYSVLSPLWFLWAVLILSMIVLFVNKVFNDSYIVYIILFVLTFLPNKLNLELYGYMYPYFVIVFLVNKSGVINKTKHINLYIFIISLIFFIILFYFFNYDSYIYTTGINIINNTTQVLNNLYRFTIGLLGCVVFVYGIRLLKINQTYKIINIISKDTMGIYAISNFIFRIIKNVTYKFSGLHYSVLIIECLIVLISSLSIIYILKKNKITSKFILGLL